MSKCETTVMMVRDRFVLRSLAMLDMLASLAVFLFSVPPCPCHALAHLLSEVPRKNDAR